MTRLHHTASSFPLVLALSCPSFFFVEHALRDSARQVGGIAPCAIVGNQVEQGVLLLGLEDERRRIQHHILGLLRVSNLWRACVERLRVSVRLGVLDVARR